MYFVLYGRCIQHLAGDNWTHLRRVQAEALERIKSDEDVSNVGVNLELVISPLEVADDCLLRERRETWNMNKPGRINTPKR